MINNTTLLFENIAKLVSLNVQDTLVAKKWLQTPLHQLNDN